MEGLWKKYLAWSDKINAPFQKHKHRLALYVVLAQTVVVTTALMNISSGFNSKLTLVCTVDHQSQSLICSEP